jgi:predicted porin
MNNKIVIAVAGVAAAFATAAHAQSSVTLYGSLDAGLTYTSNVTSAGSTSGKKLFSLGNGAQQSLFGLRGSEDLGGGLHAIFGLESGINIGSGSTANNGNLFNRQAFVGLSSDQIGTLTLGRQYDVTQDFLAPLSATGTWGGTYFAHVGNNDRLSTTGDVGLNNTVKFVSASFNGLQAGGTYSFSNNTGFANNRAYSVGGTYQYQGLKAGAVYSEANNAGATSGGAVDASTDSVAGRSRVFGAGASFGYGPAQIGAVWTQSRLDNLTTLGASPYHFNNYEVNAKYNPLPQLGLGIAYTYTNGAVGSDNTHFNQIGVQADYSLSRRTSVYAQAVYQRAAKGSNAEIYSGDDTYGASSSNNQTTATIGLRHQF